MNPNIHIPDNQHFADANRVVSSESSLLRSSSEFLNSVTMRDWVATHMLRRNGADRSVSSDNIALNRALADVLDAEAIEAAFLRERNANPALDAWLKERFLSSYCIGDFRDYPPDTVGGLYYSHITGNNLRVDIHAPYEPKSDYEFFRRRSVQVHDFEHILEGGSFDEIGELVPYFARLANVSRYIGPELAGLLNVKPIFGGFRIAVRAGLHYPGIWLTVLDAMRRGMQVGTLSGPLYAFRYEQVFHLPLAEARAVLGVNGAEDVDTLKASQVFTERTKTDTPSLAAQ